VSRGIGRIRLGLVIAAGCFAIAITDGARHATSSAPQERGAAASSNRPPGSFVLRVAVSGPLEPFGAAIGHSLMTAAQDLVFDTFLMPDEKGALISRVLRQWERIDSRHYRVQLDPSIRFSDDSPVDDQDAIASMAAHRLRGARRGEWLEIEPLDRRALVEPALLYTILHKKTESGPLGTGPYRLVSESQTGFVLERIRPVRGRIGRVEIVPYATPREVLARVLRGDTNAALGLDERQIELLEGNPRLKPMRSLSHTALAVVFNHRRLSEVARRQLAAALPVADIAKAFADGCHSGITSEANQYQELTPGRRLEVLVPQLSVSMDRAALVVRRALGRRGGEIVRVGLTELVGRSRAGSFDVIVAPLAMWPDQAVADAWKTDAPNNLLRYSNPRVDAAFDRGDYAAAKAELKADIAFVEICRRERIGVVDSRIKNPRMGWWGFLDTLQDWEVEE
jgi:hypothetical protein